MIATVTLNPAIDKTYWTARLLKGQVNRMHTVTEFAGGKGINVTKVLRGYQFPVMAMGFLGGYTGQFIEQYVESIGAVCRFTHTQQSVRCTTNVLSEDGYVTELLEPGPVISEEELDSFRQQYVQTAAESDILILSGSAPKGVPEGIYAELIEMAKKAGKKVILDTSGGYLKAGARALPFMIKPNLKELEILIGRKVRDRQEAVEAALFLQQQGIGRIMVSMGAKGLLYVSEDKVLFAKAPKVKVVNTVGCGDSVVASFAMSFLKGEEDEMTLKKAVAVSAANVTTLEGGVIPIELAKELSDEVVVEQCG